MEKVKKFWNDLSKPGKVVFVLVIFFATNEVLRELSKLVN